jgi:GR25 family glycosyltransferase involved in LPS biosynthesis
MILEQYIKKFITDGNISSALECLKECDNFEICLALTKYFLEIFENDIDILKLLSQIAFDKKQIDICYNTCCHILKEKYINNLTLSNTIELKNKCIDTIKDRYIFYNKDVILKILNRQKRPFDIITFSITTCKRLSLFIETINSFLNCCEDIEKIDRWILVDDNSSEEDKKYMINRYPFFEFIFKNKEKKGHTHSMNIILSKIKSPYLFHMEDDWKFFEKRKYITECLSVLSENEKYGQCLINKNYSELSTDNIVGGFSKITKNNTKYILHEYCENSAQYDIFNKKYNNKPNCAYWSHFSFRPSLLRTSIFKTIGNFKKVPHFEREYSYRYFKSGFLSTFLNDIYCIHIGRLTSEINNYEKKLNAYDLNDEIQFLEKNIDFKTFIINLDRRRDRWDSISKKLQDINIIRYPAIDGSKLKNSEQLQRIFDNNDYNMRKGMVGCALSHIKLYIDLYNSNDNIYCIMEDDIKLSSRFREKLIYLYSKLPDNWDICYLGCHLWKQYKNEEFLNQEKFPIPEKWNKKKSFTYSLGGTSGYLISKTGAKKLLDYINFSGMTKCIDTIQQLQCDNMNIYYSKPHIVFSDCWTLDNNTDTDIQLDTGSLTIPLEQRITEEIKKYTNPIITTDYNFVENHILEKNPNTIFFSGCKEDIEKIISKCIFKYYRMGTNTLVIVPSEHIIYETRLCKNGFYNIDDAIQYKNTDLLFLENFKKVELSKIFFSEPEIFENIILKDVENCTFLICTKYKILDVKNMYKILDFYKGKNVDIICINGLEGVDIDKSYINNIKTISVEYREEFKRNINIFLRIKYEMEIFLPQIKDKIKKYL